MRAFILASVVVCTVALASQAVAATGRDRVHAARYYVSQGASLYRAIYGTWPMTWLQVKESGLVTAELSSVTGDTVSPDDGVIDGLFDIIYLYNPTRPSVSGYVDAGKPELVITPCGDTQPLGQLLDNSQYSHLSHDVDALTGIAQAKLMNMGIMFFQYEYGRYPTSLDEFVESRFSPVGNAKIFTSNEGAVEGAGGFVFKTVKDSEGRVISAYVYWVTPRGEKLRVYF